MLLETSSEISLCIADERIFNLGEEHVTRKNKRENILLLMLGGTLRFLEDRIPITLKAGEYYIQRAGLLQEGVSVPPEEDDPPHYFYIHFTGGSFIEKGSGLPLRGKFHAEELMPYIEALKPIRNANRFQLTAELYMILSALADYSVEYNKKSDLMEMVRSYIDASYSMKLSLQSIATQFNYHPNHLARLFLAKYGITIHQYIISVRMKRARWLLLNSSETIERVTELVGYQDPSAFYRAFLSYFGEAPRTVRSANITKENAE